MLRTDEPAVGKKREVAPRPKRIEHIPGQIIVRVREAAVRRVLAAAARLRFRRTEAGLLPEEIAQPHRFPRSASAAGDRGSGFRLSQDPIGY